MNHPSNQQKNRKKKYKTYKERAEYLSFINPQRKEIYSAIAEFFGENEIPPKIKNFNDGKKFDWGEFDLDRFFKETDRAGKIMRKSRECE